MSQPETARDRIEFLRGLRAVRRFRPDPVPDEAIEDILQVARWSGTASNRQTWELVVARDRDMLRRLGELEGFAAHLSGAAAGIILVSAAERPEQETFDEGRLSERIMLAAHAHGLGSSIGWFRGAGSEEAKRILGVPAEKVLRTAISIGYPAEGAAGGRRRKPLADFVRSEHYQTGEAG